MAKFPTIGEILLEVSKAFDSDYEKELQSVEKNRYKSKDKISKEKWLDMDTKLFFSTLIKTTPIPPSDLIMYDIEQLIYNYSVMSLTTNSYHLTKEQLVFEILKEIFIPTVAINFVEYHRQNLINEGSLSGGDFWFLPQMNFEKRRLDMPIRKVLDWWFDLLGYKSIDGFFNELSDSISDQGEFKEFKETLRDWYYRNKLPKWKTFTNYIDSTKDLKYSGIFTPESNEFNEQITEAIKFVKDKKISDFDLSNEIPLHIDEITAVRSGKGDLEDKSNFLRMVKNRWQQPSIEKLITVFSWSRAFQYGYQKLTKFLAPEIKDPYSFSDENFFNNPVCLLRREFENLYNINSLRLNYNIDIFQLLQFNNWQELLKGLNLEPVDIEAFRQFKENKFLQKILHNDIYLLKEKPIFEIWKSSLEEKFQVYPVKSLFTLELKNQEPKNYVMYRFFFEDKSNFVKDGTFKKPKEPSKEKVLEIMKDAVSYFTSNLLDKSLVKTRDNSISYLRNLLDEVAFGKELTTPIEQIETQVKTIEKGFTGNSDELLKPFYYLSLWIKGRIFARKGEFKDALKTYISLLKDITKDSSIGIDFGDIVEEALMFAVYTDSKRDLDYLLRVETISSEIFVDMLKLHSESEFFHTPEEMNSERVQKKFEEKRATDQDRISSMFTGEFDKKRVAVAYDRFTTLFSVENTSKEEFWTKLMDITNNFEKGDASELIRKYAKIVEEGRKENLLINLFKFVENIEDHMYQLVQEKIPYLTKEMFKIMANDKNLKQEQFNKEFPLFKAMVDEKRVDINHQDYRGATLLNFISEYDLYYPLLKYILDNRDDVDIDLSNFMDITPLHFASTKNSRLLIKAGANVNLKTKNTKTTPLYFAILIFKVEKVKMLIEAGAKVTDSENSELKKMLLDNKILEDFHNKLKEEERGEYFVSKEELKERLNLL